MWTNLKEAKVLILLLGKGNLICLAQGWTWHLVILSAMTLIWVGSNIFSTLVYICRILLCQISISWLEIVILVAWSCNSWEVIKISLDWILREELTKRYNLTYSLSIPFTWSLKRPWNTQKSVLKNTRHCSSLVILEIENKLHLNSEMWNTLVNVSCPKMLLEPTYVTNSISPVGKYTLFGTSVFG